MKKENLLINMPADEREERLMTMACKSEYEKVRRPYSEDEKIQMKDFVVDESTTIMKQTAEFKEIQKEFSEAIKKHKEGVHDALTTLDRGYTENEEKVFMIDDQEEGMMHTYDKFGEHISSRKLLPNEKQTRVLSISTGTEG